MGFEDRIPGQESDVQQFYNGGSVFVTGATGFMGKVLVEKLIRSCPGLDAVYMLVRSKKGKTVQERNDDLVSSPCFDRLRQERGPEFKAKLIGVAGDISEEGLGLTEHDRLMLADRVNIVFHVAATVRFDEQLNVAIKQNVRATREVLALCKTCTRLKAVVHVSTAYANCPFVDVEERFYTAPMDCDKAIVLAETVDEDIVTALTERLLGHWPNSYTFTKALAEQVILRHGQGLPLAIFRPGIVVCSDKEPASGWIDNFYGPTGLLMGTATGVVRTSCNDGKARAYMVPCDLAINAILVAAWEVADKRSVSSEVPIYNFVPTKQNTITWNKYNDMYYKQILDSPIFGAIWYPFITLTNSKVSTLLMRFLLHILPALLVDSLLRIQGKAPKMLKLYEKVHKSSSVISRLGNGAWNFGERNVEALWALTTDRDKELFPFDMRSMDWDDFARRTYLGMRKFLMHEDKDTIPAARIKLRRLCFLHFAVVAVVLFIFFWLMLNVLEFMAVPTITLCGKCMGIFRYWAASVVDSCSIIAV